MTTKLLDLVVPLQSDMKNDTMDIFIVMDCVPLDLRTLLTSAEKSGFEESDAVGLLYGLLCSVNFLHSTGLIHRDIKPSNVLVNKDWRITLCDFGLTRNTSSKPDSTLPRSMKMPSTDDFG